MRCLPFLAVTLLVAQAVPALDASAATRPPAPAETAVPKSLGGAKNWSAYSAGSGKALVCYLVGKPAKTLPQHVIRGRVDAHVTHRPGENAVNVVNFELGYAAKAGSSAALTIDGKKFALFTAKEGAWASDAATDKAITIALSKGKEAVLRAVSEHNNASTDTYSLDGFGQTLALIDKACNVRR
ncbi:MAG TPA: invasion associated locus B family protein [Stellaceae bacterium]|nr:invasion associated locus B family protein [Stellaceae bacterium]